MPGFDVFVKPFKEKTALFFDFVKKIVSRFLISKLLLIDANTGSITSSRIKRLRLSLLFGGRLLIYLRTCSLFQIKLYRGVGGRELPVSFIRGVTSGCLPVRIECPVL